MRRYLVVDDNRALAENLAEIVRDSTRADVNVVSDGAQALEAVRAQRFDALVTDMRMPVMGGAAVVHAIRAVDPAVPAMVITAYTEDNELASARHEGLLAVLPKPVPVAAFVELLGVARRDGLVALVEDDEALSDNLCEALRSVGFSVVTARSVLETEGLRAVRPFAGIVDLRLPGGSDGEGVERLLARYPDLPLVVITAHSEAMPAVRHEALLRKPFATAELIRTLEALHRERARP